jgi:acyl-CoA reductase-like NAD-dependent aldehyde dehydrogenase
MRLAVRKTLKMYLNGRFIRSESGRVLPITAADGTAMHACRASRKDLRDAIGANRAALAGWAGRTAFNRGQILYRLAEMLEDRREALPTAQADAEAAVDRAVHHAGWADKITAVLSSLNPVAAAYVNYSMVRPLGVVVAVPHPEDGLLGMVEALCSVLVMGDTGTLVVPVARAELATALTEALHTSDLPGGALNVLTGELDELLPVAHTHDDLDGLLLTDGVLDDEAFAEAERQAAHVLRRLVVVPRAARPAGPETLIRLAEIKTVWMSAQGEIPTGRAGY